MEVVCIKEFEDCSIDSISGKETFTNNHPKLHDICVVIDVFKWKGIDFYKLEGYPDKNAYNAEYFDNIDDLQLQISIALKAKNPNIKKFALAELYVIGYKVPGFNESVEYWRKQLGLCLK